MSEWLGDNLVHFLYSNPMQYSVLTKLLFKLPPETAHDLVLKILSLAPALVPEQTFHAPIQVGNVLWKNPIGLAAGLDKNGVAIEGFERVGFGALELGTVTLRPQLGNHRPRIWRYVEKQDLRNAMGFPNNGSDLFLQNIKSTKDKIKVPLGINIGKNKETSEEKSIDEYHQLLKKLSSTADYIVINVSSPNTPGLRSLQQADYLESLFQALAPERGLVPVDLYLKIAPDLSFEQIDHIVEICLKYKLTGIVATNTTSDHQLGAGGLSGNSLKNKASLVRNYLLGKKTNLEIIGVGGISQFDDLLTFWKNGGKVVQVYSAFVFQGPQLIQDIMHEINLLLKAYSVKSIAELLSKLKNS